MYASSLATGAGGHISTAVTWEVSLVFSSRSTAPLSRKAKCCGSSLCSTGAFNTYVLLGVKYQFKSVTFSLWLIKTLVSRRLFPANVVVVRSSSSIPTSKRCLARKVLAESPPLRRLCCVRCLLLQEVVFAKEGEVLWELSLFYWCI